MSLLVGHRLSGGVAYRTSEVEEGMRLWEDGKPRNGVPFRFMMNPRNGVRGWGEDKASRGLV